MRRTVIADGAASVYTEYDAQVLQRNFVRACHAPRYGRTVVSRLTDQEGPAMGMSTRLKWFLDSRGIRYEVVPHIHTSTSRETAAFLWTRTNQWSVDPLAPPKQSAASMLPVTAGLTTIVKFDFQFQHSMRSRMAWAVCRTPLIESISPNSKAI